MSGNKRAAVTATNKATTKKAKQISAAATKSSAQGNKAARNVPSSATTPDKRKRTAPSTDGPASSKTQKTKSLLAATSAVSSKNATVVPATPGMRVATSGASLEAVPNTASQDEHSQDEHVVPKVLFQQAKDGRGAAPSGQKTPSKSKAPKKASQQQQQPTLPLEPHAAVLADLRPRHDVLVLSVLSSSKMEKRIASVLSHLGKPSLATPPTPLGIVLLHARSADSGKLLSVAEIAKRRIREGFYREGVQSEDHTTALAWYQYNRLYDVQTEVKEGHSNEEEDENEDEDGFQPMPQQFRAAIGDATAKQTVTKTYMSIILSRVALPELLKHPDITCQASADPVEREYQSWMIPGA
ncbi:hypothetical protein CMQ_819 [Grosmannia clavigera kw1407]|uniref:DNA/RNA-binding protein Alba-like domain-containing protein n=1 Tax=Grosmannia clavigera (strain kw1407 / UAMH 11150) TaxID=655863 RepID=F0XDV8_GROCL|nr:uncharacterized protein CMQ_819 [Grosmannia clavigera kw1407]EFX03891.1 hypothetical protein CMQ_819 [Grosmannia clavigera kw1407]